MVVLGVIIKVVPVGLTLGTVGVTVVQLIMPVVLVTAHVVVGVPVDTRVLVELQLIQILAVRPVVVVVVGVILQVPHTTRVVVVVLVSSAKEHLGQPMVSVVQGVLTVCSTTPDCMGQFCVPVVTMVVVVAVPRVALGVVRVLVAVEQFVLSGVLVAHSLPRIRQMYKDENNT
jgi:hypothetical protein|tara:strand:+ start:196 stop:714 length:519 start_codon:yes stop_codon:yes gene_type:complete